MFAYSEHSFRPLESNLLHCNEFLALTKGISPHVSHDGNTSDENVRAREALNAALGSYGRMNADGPDMLQMAQVSLRQACEMADLTKETCIQSQYQKTVWKLLPKSPAKDSPVLMELWLPFNSDRGVMFRAMDGTDCGILVEGDGWEVGASIHILEGRSLAAAIQIHDHLQRE